MVEKQRMEHLVEHLNDGIFLLDEQLRLILKNPTGQTYLDKLNIKESDGVISHIGGVDIQDLLRPRHDKLAHEIVVGESPKHTFELDARQITTGAVENGWLLVIRNVSRERQVQESTQQQDRLAAVGQLAAGIAHDFNNLLTIMMGTAQYLEMDDQIPERVKTAMRTIFTQGDRAAQLVQQILDFSRKTVVERQSFNLVPFLKETVKLLQRTLPNIEIETQIKPATCLVKANPLQLQQVITNLAVNARDAMPDGGILSIGLSHTTLSLKNLPSLALIKPGNWVIWTLSDTGTGMSPDVLKHLYEPFYTTKERGKGTGLGLSQVYGIIKQHDGFIDVKSTPNKGTTFTIYLPHISSEETNTLQEANTNALKGNGETILLVEDQEDVLHMTQNLLKGLNYQTISATTSEEALTLYKTHHKNIHLILSDIIMPKGNGTTLAHTLRKKDKKIPIVMMTGFPLIEHFDTFSALDIKFWIEKPFNIHRLAQTIHQALHPGKKVLT